MAGSSGERYSQQFGGRRLDFQVAGRGGFIIFPDDGGASGTGAGARPWVWYAPTFIGRLPKPLHAWYLTRLLQNGVCIAGVDVGESWGGPAGRAAYTAFHKACVEGHGLAREACLLPQSRGALMHYNWAVEHPACVRCIGGIYPLVNLTEAWCTERLFSAYGMDEKTFREQRARHNPVERLAPLAECRVPILHLHGGADRVVPLEENSAELARRYAQRGGEAIVRVMPGKGHEEVKAFFECQTLLDFFLEQARF